MTSDPVGIDRAGPIAGLWPGAWAAECGGPRRQKAASGGLGLQPGEHLVSTTRRTGEWNVMFVQREPGELYLQGANDLGGRPRGWVERLDPLSLETIVRSPDLPSGGHTWCGAVIVTDQGDLLVVNGRFVHRLDPITLEITAELELAADAPHNGIVPLHDGAYATKDLRLTEASNLVVIDGDLTVLASTSLPEPSMGRLAADHRATGTDLYLPGDEHLLRLTWRNGLLELDPSWRPAYRRAGGGLAWDTCLAGGRAWLLDNGDIPAVRFIHGTNPTGSAPLPAALEALASTPVTALGIDLCDPDDVVELEPFADAADGWVIAPPTFDPTTGLLLLHDTGNARLAAFAIDPVERRWDAQIWMWMQPLFFPDTGELVVDHLDAAGDHIAVIDLHTGATKDQVPTGAERPNGMFLTPGWHRDLYYATFDSIARIHVEADA